MAAWRGYAGLLVALALLPLAAQADNGWSPGLDVGGGLLHTNMQELISGHTHVTESGFLPETHGRFFLHRANLEFGASIQDAVGNIDYNGEAQNVNTLAVTPYSTSTDTTFLKAQLDGAITQGAWRLSGFGGYNLWRRSVLSSGDVGDSNEDYRWFSLGLGASYRIPLQTDLALVPGVNIWRDLHVEQVSREGDDDTLHLKPVGRGGAQLSVALAWTLKSKAEFRLRPYMQGYTFSHSEQELLTRGGQQVYLSDGEAAAAYQPEIRYLQYGIDAEYEARF